MAGKGEKREELAKKVLEHMATLGIEQSEYTKVLSRAYRLANKKE